MTSKHRGVTAVFLDPPYTAGARRAGNLYAIDDEDIGHAVREWAVEHGDDPRLRICLCGYDGEHRMPRGWRVETWRERGGYGNQNRNGNKNKGRERLWFSPHCLHPRSR